MRFVTHSVLVIAVTVASFPAAAQQFFNAKESNPLSAVEVKTASLEQTVLPRTIAPAEPATIPHLSPKATTKMPVVFVRNVGQSPSDVLWQARGVGFQAFFAKSGFVIATEAPEQAPSTATATPKLAGASSGGSQAPAASSPAVIAQRITLVGANPDLAIEPLDAQQSKTNYFLGNDPSHWARGLENYARLRYKNVYPGIDLVFYGREGKLEYDFAVAPNADPNQIRLRIDGDQAVTLTDKGELQVGSRTNGLLHRPMLYQNLDNGKKAVEGKFVALEQNTVGFQFGKYDPSKTFVIDPTINLLYSTYIGGIHNDRASALALDAAGDTYLFGFSASEDYPISGNAYQSQRKAIGHYVYNLVLTKFDASGNLLASTFLGGSTNDYSYGMTLDPQGNAYLTGFTDSSDFPVTSNAYQTNFVGGVNNGFVAELSPDGSALLYSSLVAGPGGSNGVSIAFDQSGKLFVGFTAGPGFPTSNGAYMTTLPTGYAAAVAQLDLTKTGSAQLVAATYYGTATPQPSNLLTGITAHQMALDANGNPWVVGQAYTAGLPTTANAIQPTIPQLDPNCQGYGNELASAAYLAQLSADLTTLKYASYLSGNVEDSAADDCTEAAESIAFDSSGKVYLFGFTASSKFPVTQNALFPTYPGGGGYYDFESWIAKLSADGSQQIYGSFFGGNGGDTFPGSEDGLGLGSPNIILDSQGNVWIAGATQGGTNFLVSADALQPTNAGGYDGFLTELNSDETQVLYSTYYGGSSDDTVEALAIDATNTIHLAGNTASTNFPLSANPFQPVLAEGDPGPDGSDIYFALLGGGTVGVFTPTSGGNTGDVTMTVTGVGLQTGATCSLVEGASQIQASTAVVSSSGTSITCTFALNGAATGNYNVEVTNPDGQPLISQSTFTVVTGQGSNVSVDVVGRSTIRTGIPSTFDVVVTNTGDADAYGVMVLVYFSSTLQPTSPAPDPFGLSLGVPPPAFPGDTTDYSQLSVVIPSSVIDGSVVPLLIPDLPAGQSVSYSFPLVAPADGDVFVQAYTWSSFADSESDLQNDLQNPPFGQGGKSLQRLLRYAPASGGTSSGGTSACLDKVLDDLFDDLEHRNPVAGCLDDATTYLATLINSLRYPSVWAIGQIWDATLNVLGSCSGVKKLEDLSKWTNSIRDIEDAANLFRAECNPKPAQKHPSPNGRKKKTKAKGSLDPNDKSGPNGDGSVAQWLTGAEPFNYDVAFENKPTAGLPVAAAVVTDQLDPTKVDLSTLSLGTIAFGTNVVQVPGKSNNFNTLYNLNSSLQVRIQGSLNTDTGLLKWTFQSIDPQTHLPPTDPTVGFLPPDKDGVEGQASVLFNVMPKSGQPTGTQITNTATVVFDNNPPLNTPTWLNTIDVDPPVSAVTALPMQENQTTFNVSWSGTDKGSGIATYSIYVSDTSGPYTLWQNAVATTSGSYTGEFGHTYDFYSIATDGAGNVEAPKSNADTATLLMPPPAPDFSIGESSGSLLVGRGGMASVTLTITPTGGFNHAVSFSCAGLPAHSSCSFSPATVTPNGAPVSTTMTISTSGLGVAELTRPARPHQDWERRILAGLSTGGFLGIAGVFLIMPRRRSRKVRVLIMLVFIAIAALMMVGCGSSGNGTSTSSQGTPTGTSMVTVTASSAGAVQHTVTLQLTVQ